MTQLEIINKKIEELEGQKEELISLILRSDELDKLQKLGLIAEYNLWGIDPYISEVFEEWEIECAEIEEQLAIADGKIKDQDYICDITDATFIENMHRHEIVYYQELIEYLEPSDSILVATCRGDYGAELYKSYDEIVNHIYDYAVENKSIGFELDW